MDLDRGVPQQRETGIDPSWIAHSSRSSSGADAVTWTHRAAGSPAKRIGRSVNEARAARSLLGTGPATVPRRSRTSRTRFPESHISRLSSTALNTPPGSADNKSVAPSTLLSMRRPLIAASVMLALSLGGTTPAAMAAPVPSTSCRVLPADNIWNTDISKLPVDSHSRTWLRSMKAGSTLLHPDFGRPPYGFPFQVSGNGHAMHRIRFHYASESDRVPYPFGASTPIEQGSDRHALLINRDTCTLYELYDARWNGGSPTAGSGAVFDLGSNALRPDGWTSADAAGLPIFPGLVRYDEVRAGAIRHAIRFTVECTRNRHIWPARHDAGVSTTSCPPMGARFRLKASYELSRFGPGARVVLKAMKHYGLILADNGSNWYFQGTMDKRWTDRLLDQLKRVPAGALVAVDTSSCIVKRSSGRAACPAR
jgi:hypothetical protein